MPELTPDQAKAVADAQAILDAHKAEYEAWQNSVKVAQLAGQTAPPPPPAISSAIDTIGHTLGGVLLGAGGTVADAVNIVGATADTLHSSVNDFFHNLRSRLGV